MRVSTPVSTPGAALAVAAGLLLLGARGAEARTVEKIVAVVGDDIILQSEVEERAQPFMQEIAAIPNPTQRAARANALRREVLDQLINDHLILQQAQELKLSVSAEEVDRSIEQIKKDHGLNDATLLQALRGQGQTMSSYRAELRRSLLRFRVIQIAVGSKIAVSDKELQEYYERNTKSGANLQVKASHIFIAIPEGADTATVQEKEALAKKLLERAKGDDFAKLAREHSQDPNTRADGGDLGYFGRGVLPKAIEEMVFSMRVGEVRGPVRADRGFHVIKLVDKRAEAVKPFAEVKDDLRRQLQQKETERQTRNYLSELRRRTLVELRM